jgi:hypothetical protein
MAHAVSSAPTSHTLIGDPSVAASAPTAKSSESPGRKGITTSPVSAKITAPSSTYIHAPICPAHSFR